MALWWRRTASKPHTATYAARGKDTGTDRDREPHTAVDPPAAPAPARARARAAQPSRERSHRLWRCEWHEEVDTRVPAARSPHISESDTAAPTAAPSCAPLLRAPHHELSRFACYHTTETQSDRLSGRPRACSCPPPSPLPRWASRSPSQASNAPSPRAAGDLRPRGQRSLLPGN